MSQKLFFGGFIVGIWLGIANHLNIFRILLDGVFFSFLFWGIGWWINSRKNQL